MSEAPSGWNGNVKKQIAKVGARNKGQARKPKVKAKRLISMIASGPKKLIPKYLYVSTCCGELGKKTPVVRSTKDREENKFSTNTLGKFRCSKCNKRSVFIRQPNKDGESLSI